jgi:hypothetical protein
VYEIDDYVTSKSLRSAQHFFSVSVLIYFCFFVIYVLVDQRALAIVMNSEVQLMHGLYVLTNVRMSVCMSHTHTGVIYCYRNRHQGDDDKTKIPTREQQLNGKNFGRATPQYG